MTCGNTIHSVYLLQSDQSTCPKCHGVLSKRSITLPVQLANTETEWPYVCSYCSACKRHFATSIELSQLCSQIAHEKHMSKDIPTFRIQLLYSNGAKASGFRCIATPAKGNRTTALSVAVQRAKNNPSFLNILKVLPRASTHAVARPRTILLTLGDFPNCCICHRKLTRSHVAIIPITKEHCVRCELAVCYHCNMLYSQDRQHVTALQQFCQYKTSLTVLDPYKQYIDQLRQIEPLGNVSSGYCRVLVCTERRIRMITIVTHFMDVKPDKDYFHYTNRNALRILTALFLDETTAYIEGENYTLQTCEYSTTEQASFKMLSPQDMVIVGIGKNGGYYSPDDDKRLVDGLIFCEKSHCLEILSLTYMSSNGTWEYYVDYQLLKDFYQLNGFPIVELVYDDCFLSDISREESLLHLYGYNVNARQNLTSAQRHDILSRIVDLGIMPVSSVVSLLQLLIRRNGVHRPESRQKWIEDCEYMADYKVTHERFAFVHYIRKKLA